MGRTVDAARNTVLSEERVYDSSDEDENEVPSEQETAISKSKSSPLEALNGIDTDEEEETDEEEPGVEKSSEENGEDDSDEDSASSSSSSRKRRSPETPEIPSNKKARTATRDKVSIPPKPFKPPKGYEPLTWSASDFASDMDLFGDLSNKQIWHISVPESVSIDSIKELDIEAVLRGRPILSRNGVDYGMHALPSKDNVILLPRGSDAKYKQCARKIERSFSMREVSKSQSVGDTPAVFTATQTGAPKQIRKQPEGLKMRYMPYGVSPTQEDRPDDVEMRDTLQVPPDFDDEASSPPAQSRKARQKQTNGEAGNEKSPEKKLRSADTPASSEKKKKKKRRLADE
ncbi:uncharacterized protein Z519_09630 [Cladophialophora bantiana CBS 173.52]|uniref:Uncharacterized protein n=1 Tax=Cladophialophora bantiana (strain ATCC 10958 / CBS 173.52 / CDC B-1940 / NIH 8579) TaxID=1442370 RepID=A0A0D2HY57_CLAB1|nr:uncharacterized protein Z519_09630 [Cladophialophora bantiana CBS 173.52]KIW89474.1 hypothetical protein Z519_09630 [Cladophialophora bantiana CBS 173.52]